MGDNETIINILKQLANNEKNSGNRYKANAYRKAVQTIQAHPGPIRSGKDAKELPGIGDKIAKKIDEILSTGKLNKLESANADERMQAINLLARVFGVGPISARKFVDSGITTLEQLGRQKLNHQQQLGIKYFEDFEKRIPRNEVSTLERVVQTLVHEIDPVIVVHVCGSYRRGAETSGDVDFLISHPDYHHEHHAPPSTKPPKPAEQTLDSLFAKKRKRQEDSGDEGPSKRHKSPALHSPQQRSGGVFEMSQLLFVVIEKLKTSGILVDHISEGHAKYMGVCQLPKSEWQDESIPPPFRRIDIRAFPIECYYTALLYFTGSDLLNKQMRERAIELGLHLSEYAITAVGAKGEKSDPLPVTNEEDVFAYLNMDYLTPEQRNL